MNPTNPRSPGEVDLRRRFRRLTAINVASNLTVPLTGLVDTAMLGRLDEIRFLAGVALGAVIFDMLYFGFGFLRMSTTGETAQAYGRGRDTSQVLWRSLVVGFGLGIVILILHPIIENLSFRLLDGSTSVEAAGRDYFQTRILGAPAALAQLALVGWLLGRGRSGDVLAVLSVTNLGNVALNWWFIVHLGWASAGAGAASAGAQWAGALLALALVFRIEPDLLAGLAPSLRDRGEHLRLLRLNGQIFGRTLLLVSCFALFTNGSATFGASVLAANSILLRLLGVLSYLVDGVAYATETISGQLWGAQRWRTARSMLGYALFVGSVLGAAVWLPGVLAPRIFLALLTDHADVVDLAAASSIWLVPIGIFGSIAYVLDGFFLGLTRGRILLIAMIASAVPALGLMVFAVRSSSPKLLWTSLTLLMLLRAVTLGWAAWKRSRNPQASSEGRTSAAP